MFGPDGNLFLNPGLSKFVTIPAASSFSIGGTFNAAAHEYDQRNVVFASCIDTGSGECTTTNTIVSAQVNYEGEGLPTPIISKTYIQSWTAAR